MAQDDSTIKDPAVAALWARAERPGAQDSARDTARGPADSALGDDDAALALAAYLDGGLGEAERDRVEAWLAEDPAALELMLASRQALAAGEAAEPGAEAVPAGLIARAQGAVREAPRDDPAPAGAGGSWLGRLLGGWLTGGSGGLLQPVGIAAALLLAVLAGAELAHSSFANLSATGALQVVQAEPADGDLGLPGDELF